MWILASRHSPGDGFHGSVVEPEPWAATAIEDQMKKSVMVILTETERDQLLRSLVLHQASNPEITQTAPLLSGITTKLASAGNGPNITIGVHGGLVQWVMGNPFPVRICDYDGEDHELPELDERDQRCNMRITPPDLDWQSHVWKRLPSDELDDELD
jgi:hypothetical protein